jgi:hypothetical protein
VEGVPAGAPEKEHLDGNRDENGLRRSNRHKRVACGARIASMRSRLPMFLADFWNEGPASAGGHRDKPEYKNLFRFRQKPPEA